jgi:hypothetical protein
MLYRLWVMIEPCISPKFQVACDYARTWGLTHMQGGVLETLCIGSEDITGVWEDAVVSVQENPVGRFRRERRCIIEERR